ncbi:START domain-containing protein [Kordia algicida OT-1]|uniref:Protein containing StAR-related lipid-transfer (START) domain n=1 Tax=Kordia algicida OT-1 TaxID=391587 RepID=A9EAA4_9FLAO|nr:START domain-containing protein [Kordia algicida]EDP94606.1 protein containing StAR-related lipid-transfer (START) domain [Kordia algicida OT-1]
MENENKPAKPKRWKKILKYIGIGLGSLIIVLYLYNLYWVNSGSNEWELEIDKDGVQVYSLKVPGDNVVKFRTIFKGKYTLSQLAAPHLLDHNLETCKEWFENCVDCEIIEPFDTIRQYDVSLWTLDFPSPFQPRELLINTSVKQDENKVVTIDVISVPNAVEHNKGKIRVERMHNVWQFTPLGNGMAQCQLTQDISLGGFFPSFLMNMAGKDANYDFMKNELPKFLEKEKYKNAKFPFIEEL